MTNEEAIAYLTDISYKLGNMSIEYLTEKDGEKMREAIKVTLNNLPSVTPQPKTGHWIRWYKQKESAWYTENIPYCKCSECGKEYDPHLSQFIKYCPNCGAKMEKETEEWLKSEVKTND